MKATIRVVFDKLPALSEQMHDLASKAVRKCALDIEAAAKAELYEGHGVDTGFMKSSIQATGVGGAEMKPGDLSAEVNVGAEYAAFVEWGSRGRAPIPFMTPAAEGAKPGFVAAMQRIAKL